LKEYQGRAHRFSSLPANFMKKSFVKLTLIAAVIFPSQNIRDKVTQRL
jgi:hypothetical protein